MPEPRQLRLPLGPLWAAVERRHTPAYADIGPGCVPGARRQRLRPFGPIDVARATGCPVRQVIRWRHEGLTVHAADRAAVALGLHPANLWGDDFWAGTEAVA